MYLPVSGSSRDAVYPLRSGARARDHGAGVGPLTVAVRDIQPNWDRFRAQAFCAILSPAPRSVVPNRPMASISECNYLPAVPILCMGTLAFDGRVPGS